MAQPAKAATYCKGGGLGGRGVDHDGVLHGAVAFQGVHHLGHGGFFLADGHVNAENPGVFLVDDGIHAQGGFADLAVADDQFALAPADRGHGVNGLIAGVHGLINRLALDDAGGLDFDAAEFLGIEGAFAVDGVAHRVDDPAQNSRHLRAPGRYGRCV